MADFFGIVLYDIEKNGCGNGVFTNTPNDGKIFNEIIQKIDRYNDSTDCVVGDYRAMWFDVNNGKEYNCVLKVRLKAGCNSTYIFQWKKGSKTTFEGVGYKMNDRQIAVSYWCL